MMVNNFSTGYPMMVNNFSTEYYDGKQLQY